MQNNADVNEGLRRRAPEPLPLTLLTGFLGAGKTTLLNRWVQSPELSGAVVIINEFGEVAIDHLLIETADAGLLTLASGCICCSVRGDLVATLEDLLRRRDNGRMALFDRIVIETTGLADPAPILNAVALHPYLMLRYRVEGIVTAVDALHGLASLDQHEDAVRQVAVADALVLTKTDLLDDPAAGRALRQRLAGLNPRAAVLDASRNEASAAAILAASLTRAPGPRPVDHDHAGHGHDHDDHDHSHHHAHIGSFVLTGATPLAPAAVEMFIDLLRSTHGSALLRVKGLLALADDPDRPIVIQGVQHTFHPARRLAAWPDKDRTSRLVVIGRDLDRRAIERLWAAFFEPPLIDQPDGAALALSFRAGSGGLF